MQERDRSDRDRVEGRAGAQPPGQGVVGHLEVKPAAFAPGPSAHRAYETWLESGGVQIETWRAERSNEPR